MSLPNTLTIKVVHGQEIRRLSFPKAPTFSALVQLVGNLYNLTLDRVKPLLYRDDENDVVTIGSDLELLEAIRVAESRNQSLRLYVTRIAEGAEEVELPPEAETEGSPSLLAADHASEAAPAFAPLAAVRDAAILRKLASQGSEAIAQLQDLSAKAEIPQRFAQLKAAAQREMDNASDAVRPYLVALQAYIQALTSGSSVDQLKHLLLVMQQQAQRLVISSQDALARLPPAHPSFEGIDKIPAQLYAMPGQVLAVPGQVLSALPSQLAALPGQIASLPSQLRYYTDQYYPAQQAQHPAPVVEEKPAPDTKPATGTLPPDAAQQDVQVLEAMGFTDRERNIRLLAKHKGNIQLVVSELLCDSA